MLSLTDIRAFYPPSAQHSSRFLLREYLQCKILEIIFAGEHAAYMCFIGGTCLRLMHGNQRFSEDLDFDHFDMPEPMFDSLALRLEKELVLQGFRIEMQQLRRGAWHCYLKFPDVLFQTGLSGHREEKILIQIDAQAQNFDFKPEKKLLRQFDVFSSVPVPPLSLLLSHKLTAILQRPRSKGRDFFDVLFLQARTSPDYRYLAEKLEVGDSNALRERLMAHCQKLNFSDLAEDVKPFLFDEKDIRRILLFPAFVEQTSW